MALTELQRGICRLIAANRIAAPDIDLFHDSKEALDRTWRADRVLAEWVRDSAFRFFPLVEHQELGLTLHPFDLATNKVLALVGRLEVRDWVDVIECHSRVQPFGYLTWAACGKDPGFSPAAILAEARRSSRYSEEEVRQLAFSGPPPDAALLARRFGEMLTGAADVHDLLPPQEVGKSVLTAQGHLFRGEIDDLGATIAGSGLRFHPGKLRGAFPEIRPLVP